MAVLDAAHILRCLVGSYKCLTDGVGHYHSTSIIINHSVSGVSKPPKVTHGTSSFTSLHLATQISLILLESTVCRYGSNKGYKLAPGARRYDYRIETAIELIPAKSAGNHQSSLSKVFFQQDQFNTHQGPKKRRNTHETSRCSGSIMRQKAVCFIFQVTVYLKRNN